MCVRLPRLHQTPSAYSLRFLVELPRYEDKALLRTRLCRHRTHENLSDSRVQRGRKRRLHMYVSVAHVGAQGALYTSAAGFGILFAPHSGALWCQQRGLDLGTAADGSEVPGVHASEMDRYIAAIAAAVFFPSALRPCLRRGPGNQMFASKVREMSRWMVDPRCMSREYKGPQMVDQSCMSGKISMRAQMAHKTSPGNHLFHLWSWSCSYLPCLYRQLQRVVQRPRG